MGQCSLPCLPCTPQLGRGHRSTRKVGRERRYSRQLLQQNRLERLELQTRTQRRLDTQNTCWLGDIRLGTLVSPRCRTFAAEYKLTTASVGKGMSGHVRLACARQEPQCKVAVKTLDKKGLSQRALRDLRREVDIYLRMDHAHIVQLLRVFDEHEKIYLVMEYCSGGSLAQRLEQQGHYTEQAAADAIRQVLRAVSYCHSRPVGAVCHRDLKLANFVYVDDGELLKLVDFGLSRVLAPGGPRLQNCAGTLDFMAPEVLLRRAYNESCDLWSVGVMAFCLLTGHRPYGGTTEAEVMDAIQSGKLQTECEVWRGTRDSSRDFVLRLLELQPSEHPWLAKAASEPSGEVKTRTVSGEVLRSVRSFASESPANRAVAALLAYADGAPAGEDVDFVEEQFRMLDTDGNGTLSLAELMGPLREALGVSEEECQRIFDGIDVVNDHEIQRSEFLAAATFARLVHNESAIRRAFNRLDLDQDGQISVMELTAVLGQRFCGEPSSKIFREWDSNGDQAVSFEEFMAVLERLRRRELATPPARPGKCCSEAGKEPTVLP